MRLKNVARYFDTCPAYDGYSGAYLFKVQASTFMEAAAEGSVSVRRTLSLDPALTLPAHSVVTVLGDRYVTGEVNSDEWGGEAIRKTCWVRKVSDYFTVTTPQQLLTGSTGYNLYGQKRQLKEVTTLTSSELENYWEASLSTSSTVGKGAILKSGAIYFRVRLTYRGVDGFLTCYLDQLQYVPIDSAVGTGKTYDPITDSYVGTSTTVKCLPVDYNIMYDKQTQADFSVAQGDICLLLPLEANPSTGLTLSISSTNLLGEWRVLNAVKELDAWNVHVRRV